MRQTNRELDARWTELERALGAYLAVMTDPDEEDHLRIELTAGDEEEEGCAPYAQFASFGNGHMLRAEVSGNAYLAAKYAMDDNDIKWWSERGWHGHDEEEDDWYVERPIDETGGIARDVIAGLRQVFGVAHPDLLTYAAWGPASDAARALGLVATDDIPAEASASWAPLARMPENRDDMLRMLAEVIADVLDDEPTTDGDGDFVIEHRGHTVWIGIHEEQPAVKIFTRLVADVPSRRATAVELGILNRNALWSRWVLRGRAIWQELTIPALPFVPMHVQAMIAHFIQAMDDTCDDLTLRVGGRIG